MSKFSNLSSSIIKQLVICIKDQMRLKEKSVLRTIFNTFTKEKRSKEAKSLQRKEANQRWSWNFFTNCTKDQQKIVKFQLSTTFLTNFRIFGSVNPRQPNQFFKILIIFLRFDGIWPPDTKNQFVNTVYLIYSRWHRFFWLHLYVVTQAIYFKDVGEIGVIFERKLGFS